MGIFSSKKKTVVDTAVVRIIDETQIPNSLQHAALTSLFTKQRLVDAITSSLNNSPVRNFERMYRWAKAGNYHYGLPDVRIMTTSDGIAALEAVLQSIAGVPVTVEYALFRPINNIHMGWKTLTEEYGYDHETNEITSLSTAKGYPVYLEGMEAVYSSPLEEMDPTAVGIWEDHPAARYTPGRPLNIVEAIKALTVGHEYSFGPTEGVILKYVWDIPAVRDEDGLVITPGSTEREELFVSLADYDLDAEYFQAKYYYSTGFGTQYAYFTYLPGDGAYPTLDDVYAMNYIYPGTYFPFVVFRREKQNRATPALEGTPEYQSTKELLDIIKMDFQQMADNIHENPDIDDVEQAVLMMAVPITSQDPVDIDYLMRFYESILEKSEFYVPSFGARAGTWSEGVEEGYAIEFADADFRMIHSLDGVIRRVVSGYLGPVGTFTNTVETVQASGLKIPIGTQVRIFRKQISSRLYLEIRVHNPKIRFDIFEDKATIGTGEDDRCVIPLDYDICKQMPILDREKLYYRSLHLIANSRVTVKVRWYESSFFRGLLVIAAVVISFATGGATFQAIATAAAAGATALVLTVLEIVITQLISGYLITEIATAVAELLGPELAALIAAAAIIYGGYQAYKTGGLVTGSTAEKLLSAGNGLAKGSTNALRGMMQDLQTEMEEFQQYRAAKIAELEEAQDEIRNLISVDPFVATGMYPAVLFGESPTRYFNRSIHAGNIGPRSMDVVRNYVDVALSLPTIQDTIGTPLPRWV